MDESQENQAESLSESVLHPTAMVINGHHGHQNLATSCITDLPSQGHSPRCICLGNSYWYHKTLCPIVDPVVSSSAWNTM